METMDAPDSDLRKKRNVGWVFVVVGGMIAVGGLIWAIDTAAFVKRAVKASGTVIEIERGSSWRRGSTFHPVFTFADASGATHTHRSSIGAPGNFFEPGAMVTVLYDAADPDDAKIDSYQQIWLGPWVLGGFGILFGGFGAVFNFLVTRRAKTGKAETKNRQLFKSSFTPNEIAWWVPRENAGLAVFRCYLN